MGRNFTNSMSRHLDNNTASPSISPLQISKPTRQKDKDQLLLPNKLEIVPE